MGLTPLALPVTQRCPLTLTSLLPLARVIPALLLLVGEAWVQQTAWVVVLLVLLR